MFKTLSPTDLNIKIEKTQEAELDDIEKDILEL